MHPNIYNRYFYGHACPVQTLNLFACFEMAGESVVNSLREKISREPRGIINTLHISFAIAVISRRSNTSESTGFILAKGLHLRWSNPLARSVEFDSAKHRRLDVYTASIYGPQSAHGEFVFGIRCIPAASRSTRKPSPSPSPSPVDPLWYTRSRDT